MAKLALQLRFGFDMGRPRPGLVGASPERPSDDVRRADAALGQPHGHAPDFLHGPSDQATA